MSSIEVDKMGKETKRDICNLHLVYSHGIVAAREHIECNALIEDESESTGTLWGVWGGEKGT